MERAWIIVSCLLAAVAFVLVWRGNMDGAFVTGALGLLAWFLSIRSRLTKANPATRKASNVETDDTGEQDET